jgi:hypothetical protein
MVELVLDAGKHYSNHFLGVIKKIGRDPKDFRNQKKKTPKLVQNMPFTY